MTSHLTLTLLQLVLTGRLPVEVVLREAYEHLLERCDACQLERNADRALEDPFLPLPEAPPPSWRPAPLPAQESKVSYADLELRLEREERRARQRRLARRQLTRLRCTAREDRIGVIERARRAYRSRAFAELLIEESRQRVRNDPVEAENLAALVPVVVRWIPGAQGKSWSLHLELLAAAWRANALRVAGDLQAADRTFAVLRQRLQELPGLEGTVRGEIASLEGSLRLGQRRPQEAEECLAEAATLLRRRGWERELARVLLKKAGLHHVENEPAKVLETAREAARLVPEDAPNLLVVALNSQAVALCDLGRHEEAGAVLRERCETLDRRQLDQQSQNLLHSLRGRIALGLGRHGDAEAAFQACRDGYLATGRLYDAVLVSLDLAQAYLEAGRIDELEELAAELVPQFRARGVARETLAALHLLAKAASARQVTAELLTRLRGRLQAGQRGASR